MYARRISTGTVQQTNVIACPKLALRTVFGIQACVSVLSRRKPAYLTRDGIMISEFAFSLPTVRPCFPLKRGVTESLRPTTAYVLTPETAT